MNFSFSKSIFFSFLGFGLLVLSNVVFNFFSARFLGPVSYGEFNSFFYLLLAFSQPNNSLQLAVAKIVSKDKATKEVSSTIFFIGLFLFFILMIFLPFLFKFYGINNYKYTFFGSFIVLLWLLCAGFRGIYQGRLDFFTYGINIGLEGIFRVIAVVLLFYAGLKIEGAILSSVFAGVVALILLLSGIYDLVDFRRVNFNLILETLKAFSVLLPFGLIFQIDLTLSQFFLSKLDIGYISACSLYGKNLVILSMVFANVVFSYVIKKDDRYFLWGNLLTVVIFLFTYVFTLFFGKWIIFLIQGNTYLKASEYLPLYILFSLPVGIMQQIVNYSFAKDIRPVTFLMWILLFIFFALPFIFFKGEITVEILLVFLLIIFIVFDILILPVILWYNRKMLLTRSKK